MTFQDFLQTYFYNPDGLNLVVGFLLSIIVEKFPKWDELAPIDKRLIVYSITIILAAIGTGLNCAYTGNCSFDAVIWPALRTAGEVFAMAHIPHTAMMYLEVRAKKVSHSAPKAD